MRYEKKLTINFNDFYREYNLKGTRLMEMLSTVSINQTIEQFNLPPDYMQREGCIWVLYAWKIKMIKSDLYQEEIEFTTFPVIEKDIYCYRYYILKDKEKNVVGYAFAHWISVDMKTRRLTSIPSSVLKLMKRDGEDSFKDDEKKVMELIDITPLRKRRNAEFTNEAIFQVGYFHIDGNNHVNNSIYNDWALETIFSCEREFFERHIVIDTAIVYKKEKKIGGHVLSKYIREGNKTYHEIFDEEGSLLTILEYVFEENK